MALPAFHIYKFCTSAGTTHNTHHTLGHEFVDWNMANNQLPNFGTTGMGSDKWEIAHFGDTSFNGMFGWQQGPLPGEFFRMKTWTEAMLPSGLQTWWQSYYPNAANHPGCGPNHPNHPNSCYEKCWQYLGKYECGDTMINGEICACYGFDAPMISVISDPILWLDNDPSTYANQHHQTCGACSGIGPPMYECTQLVGAGCTCMQTPTGTLTLAQCQNLIAINDPTCCPPILTSHCYCCYNNINVVGVIQQLPIGQSCSVLNGTNGYTDCHDNHLLVECGLNKPKHCYCCDGTSGIGVNQAANPLPPGQDCSYYNSLTYGWYDCDDDWTTLECNDYANDCTCCDNGSGLSMGPAPFGQNCSWFNTLGYTLCDLTTNFNLALCEPDPNEHCACCKNGQMTMVGLPLPLGQDCSWWSGMYGWNSCTGATFFNIDDCEDCHCDDLIGTGRTDAFAWNQEDDCLEGCCDPDLKKCDVLVVGDNEGVQVYSTTGDNTTHLFDVPSHDTKDIAANQNFIWVYKVTGGGTQIDEYQLVMAPFTNIYRRTITINAMDIGNGLTFYGVNAGNTYLTSVNTQTLELEIPFGPPGTNITITPTPVNQLPAGYKCTGDILTRGMGSSSVGFNNSLDAILYDNGTTYKVGKFQRLTGVVLEEHIISPALMTGTTKFHSLYTDVPNNRLAGITTDGRIYELEQNPILQFGSIPIGHIDFYNTGGTETIYGATNVDYGDGTCAGKILAYPKTYNCTINGCIDPNDGTGQYTGPTASADCNTACIITWNCNPGTGYPNCTNTVTSLPWSAWSIPLVQSGPDAILYISTASVGLQYDDFNTISFYWGLQPVLPGQCSKWSSGGARGLWKISEISHPQITTTIPIQSWAAFISTLQANGLMGMVNMSQNYTQVQNICYAHFGAQYQIDVTYEPCICTPIPCSCTPLIGTTGSFLAEDACMLSCCPQPPCTVCCQSNTSWYTWMSTSLTVPCYCPSNATQVPCITCNKCCTNGTLQIMLNVNDQNCDCANYGLWSCYLAPCDKCCYNKHTGMVSPAQLPDCTCAPGEWMVPCHSLPHDTGIRCVAAATTTGTTGTTATTGTTNITIMDRPADNAILTTGTNVNVSSATKIYIIYDTSSLGTNYILSIQNSVSDWLISNGLTTNNVESIPQGDERYPYWIKKLYNGNLPTPNIGTPAYSDDVLVIAFMDEANTHYHLLDSQGSPNPIPQMYTWQSDYNEFKTTHSQITGNFNAVLYATCASNNTSLERRAFAMQAFQGVSSGNNFPLDGRWQTGTAPRPASQGGTVGGVPELCSNANLEKLEISNPYWNGSTPTYGGLDQFGWKVNVRFEPITSAILTYDLNVLLPPAPPLNPDTPVDATQGIVIDVGPVLPSTYNSQLPIAFYLCVTIGFSNGGTGNGCYGFDANGLWTSPSTGQVMQATGCTPWHLGGNCYGWEHDADVPAPPAGPGSPPERGCTSISIGSPCLYS